jgi:hypothetical protein
VQDLHTGALWQVTEIEGEGASLGGWRWSPDGKRFVYTVRAGAGRKLLLPNYAGRLVTANSFPRTLPGDPATEVKVYVTPAEGGAPVAMEPGPWGEKVLSFGTPQWSPDSRWLLRTAVHPNLKQAAILVNDQSAARRAWWRKTRTRHGWSRSSRHGRPTPAGFCLPASAMAGRTCISFRKTEARRGSSRAARWQVDNDRTFGHEPQWAGDFIYFASTEAGTAERQFYRIHPDGNRARRSCRRAKG